MHSLIFWRDWPKPHRTLLYVLFAIFISSVVYMWFAWFQGAHGIIDWQRMQEQRIVETTVHQFRLGPFQLNVPGESYVIFEYLHGSDIEHNTFASLFFLGVLVFSAMVLLTVITTLKRLWYYIGMGMFILFVFSLRLEVLQVFGIQGYVVPATTIFLFTALSFYFKSFRSSAGLGYRLAAFIALAAVCGVVIYTFSKIPFPMLHLVVTAYLPALILSALFIIMVAHEILAAFVYIASQGTSKSLKHFLIISLIYIVNVLITCLHELGVVQWDFIYINLYLLLFTSAILGLWGFKLREPLYESLIYFRPAGAFFYVALGSICFVTISQLLGNANDAALKVVRDLIIFSHTGYGIIFMTYVFSNFMVMMAENLPVHKLLYKPNRMPFFTFRLAGLIAMLAFLFYSDWRQFVYHGLAGFYNYVADLYVLQDRDLLAENFYDESRNYAFQNHRANYALATIKSSRLNFEEAHYNYQLANGRRPTDFSVVNDGNLFLWEKKYFQAIEAYRNGSQVKPSNVLDNNLGYAYGKIHSLDSATFFMSRALEDRLTKTSAQGNFLALAAAEYLPVRTDSILNMFSGHSPVVLANALALATLLHQELDAPVDPLEDSTLDLYSATLLNNYCIRNAKLIDTTFIQRAYTIASDSVNFDYREALKATLSHAFYHQGNVTQALQVLGELAYLTQDYGGKYNYIMGLWTLDQGNPEMASTYFMHAATAEYKDSHFYNAIALTESGNVFQAYAAWDSIARKGEPNEKEIAVRMQTILALNQTQALQLSDAEKYQFCRYKIGLSDTLFFNRITNAFDNPNYKAQALLDMARKQFRVGNLTPAIRYLNQISGLELSDRELYNEVQHMELLMLAWRGELALLANQINKGVSFEPDHKLEKMLYTALLSEASGDLETASRNFKLVGTWNPYFEEGIIAAANFFRQNSADTLAAYTVLVEAIQVNYNSLRLLTAYAEEAERLGFDEYAASARQRLSILRKEVR